MMRGDWLAWWLAALVAAAFFIALRIQLSPDSRLRRRRRKNHSRIVAKGRGPTVRFSVDPPKEEQGK